MCLPDCLAACWQMDGMGFSRMPNDSHPVCLTTPHVPSRPRLCLPPAAVEKAASQLSSLKQPRTAATAAAALGGLGFLALNFHTTLQFLGVVS